MKLYSEADVDSTVLQQKRIAILGYGSQGRAHALRERGDEEGLLKVLDLLTKVRERLRGDV